MSRKVFAVVSLIVLASLLLSACEPQTVVQTVEVVKEKEVVKTVEVVKEKEVVKEVEKSKASFSTPHPILSDLRVRQAMDYCTNRLELIKAVYPLVPEADQKNLVMHTFIPRSHWAYAGDDKVTIYPFDPEKGKALLEEAGWKLAEGADIRTNDKGDELSFKFVTTSATFRQTWAAVWESQMRACGIGIVRMHVPASWLFGDATGLKRRDYELAAFAWVGQADPGGQTLYACDEIPTVENGWKGQNGMGWCNEAASKNIKLANNTMIRQERIDAYTIVQQEFTKDVPSIPLFNRTETFAYNVNMTGVNIRPGEEYWTQSVANWEIPGKDTIVIGFTQEPSTLLGPVVDAAVAHGALATMNGVYASTLDYDYQPVLQKELPSLEKGTATLAEVEVKEGASIVDANGDITELKPGVKIKDASGAEVEFKGGTAKMKQLTVKYLFNDLKWPDGTPVTKADYELSYKVNCDRDLGATTYITCDKTEKMEFLDNGYIITWKPGVQDPTYQQAPYLASGRPDGFYPANRVLADGRKLADVPAKEWSTLKEVTEMPWSIGPYILKEWVKGEKMVFEANPNWTGTPPKTKNIVIAFITAENAEAQLLGGQVDILGSETLVGVTETLDKAAKDGKIKLLILPGATWEHIDINMFLR